MDSKERFTDRVDTYVKYRPTYPREALNALFGEVGLRAGNTVADMGAGTGIFSRLLLEHGAKVVALEPNAAMREAAVQTLGNLPNYRAESGSAEASGLVDASVDHIVCAQSFHWFDRELAGAEFRRILRPGGKVVLIWNTRLTEGTPFLEGYEQLLHEYGLAYQAVSHRNISGEELRAFFPAGMQEARFVNRTRLDFEELRGRLLSSSYSPMPGHPNHEPMLKELEALFERCQSDGKVDFDYVAEIYWGEM